MTKMNEKLFHKTFSFFFRIGLCLFVFAAVTPSARADEGTAASAPSDIASAVSAVDPAVPAATTAESSSQGSGSFLGNAWSNVKKTVKNGVSLGNAGGFQPRVRPHLHGESSWNSNSNLGRSNSGAWEGRLSPGVTLDLPFGDKLYGQVGYNYTYSTTQGPRISTHTNSHTIDAMLRYDATAKTAMGIKNSTRWNEMPGQPGNMFFLETLTPEVRHKFGTQLSTGLQYIYQHYSDITSSSSGTQTDFFRSAITNDSFTDHGVVATSQYEVSKRLSLGPNFDWHVRRFSKTESKDYWQIQPTLGATYQLGPKTKLGGHFGWAYRRFDVGDGYESELVYGAHINHLLSRKLVWGLSYNKSLTDTFDTSFVFDPISPEASNLDNFDRHFRVIKSHRIGTTLAYNINEKNSVGGNFDFQASSADNNDNVVSNDRMNEKKIETGVYYLHRLTKYISLKLGYAFGRSFVAEDNPSRSQYTFHKIIAGVNVAF